MGIVGPMIATAGSIAGDCCGGVFGDGCGWGFWMRERRKSPPFDGGNDGKLPPPPFMAARLE